MAKILRVEEKIKNNKKFFFMENEDGPVIGFQNSPSIWYTGYEHAKSLVGNSNITCDNIDIEGILEDDLEYLEKNNELYGNSIWGLSPFCAIPWMDVMLGAKFEVSKTSFAPSTHSTDITKESFEKGALYIDKKWENRLLENIRLIKDRAKDRIPVIAPNLRGPSDLLQLFFDDGYKNFVLNLFDKPVLMQRIISKLTEFYIEVRKKTFNSIPSFYGGSIVINHYVWLPGQTFFLQEDAAGSIMSKELYRKFIFEGDCKILNTFPGSVFHLHSGFININIIDFLFEKKDLNFVTNIVMDPINSSRSIDDLIIIIKNSLNHKKPVYIDCQDYPIEWIEELAKKLPDKGRGVFLQIRADSGKESKEKMERIEELMKKNYTTATVE